MTPEDLSFIIFYIICGIVALFIGIMKIIKAEKKDDINEGVLLILVSFTPGIMFIGILVLFVGFGILITEGPTWLIAKLKNIKE